MLKNNQAYLVAPPQGFTLLEVMISSVILTVSLLGIAGMYGFASKFSYEARQHTQAVYIANDMMERLRMSKIAWLKSVLLNEDSSYQLNINNQSTTVLFPECNKKQNCRYNDLILHDVTDWQQHLASAFPSSSASICLSLKRRETESAIDADLTVNWIINNADKSAMTPVLNVECGQNETGRRQYMMQMQL